MSVDVKRSEGARRSNLGRGLSALFGDVPAAEEPAPAQEAVRPRAPRHIPIEFLHPGRYQPRRQFDEVAIAGLADSIRDKGILQPLVVRRSPEGGERFEIICGERRWRAAQIAGLHELPVVVRDLDDREALEVSLIENLQREDLNALEEAEGYQRLMEEFAHTQEDLARVIGKSRPHVANMLRLLGLPDPVKRLVEDGTLTAGHARALLTAADPVELARQVTHRGMSVRQTEQLVRSAASAGKAAGNGGGGRGGRAAVVRDPDLAALEEQLAAQLGLKVTITPRGRAGTVAIDYQTLDQLDDVLHRLRGE